MDPLDIPTEITKLVYLLPASNSKAYSQNQAADLLAHFWPAIEQHIREQIAREIEADTTPSPWGIALADRSVNNNAWIDRRDAVKAARIARGTNPN